GRCQFPEQMRRSILAAAVAAGALSLTGTAAPATPITLYSQYDDVPNTYVTSQHLLPGPNLADDEAADDFVVPDGTSWRVTQVTIRGDWNLLTHPIRSFNVRFYDSAAALPGVLQREVLQASFSQSFFDLTISLGNGVS